MPGSGYDARHYHTFVVRLWQERPASPGRPAVWRCSVEDTRTGQRRGFAGLEALTAFLQAQMAAADEPTGQEGGEASNVKRDA